IFFAACKDGKEMIYPIAYGFADGESDCSWTWFLRKLRLAIGVSDDLLIVSDRHKSISNGMKEASFLSLVVHHFLFF
ncbi:transposase, partial [Klebsiella pneumoniae]